MSLTHHVLPLLLMVIAGLVLLVVADARVFKLVVASGAETFIDREAKRFIPSDCNALTART
jgi:hypothetical protein